MASYKDYLSGKLKVTAANVSKAVSSMAAAANKRLKRLQEQGWKYIKADSERSESADTIAGHKKFGAKGKSLQELFSEFKRLVDFFESGLSSVSEVRKQAKEFITSIFSDEYADGLNQVSVVGFNYTAGGNSNPTQLMEGAASVVRFSSGKTVATTVDEANKLAEKIHNITGYYTEFDSLINPLFADVIKIPKLEIEEIKAYKTNIEGKW